MNIIKSAKDLSNKLDIVVGNIADKLFPGKARATDIAITRPSDAMTDDEARECLDFIIAKVNKRLARVGAPIERIAGPKGTIWKLTKFQKDSRFVNGWIVEYDLV